jgi:hypothetical protein
MQSNNILPICIVIAAALAGCQAETSNRADPPLAPSAGWITPDPVHSTVNSGSVSDAASGSMVIEEEHQ